MQPDAMVLECDFSRDLFDEASIARYVGHFLTLLQGIVANPFDPLTRLPLLDAAAGQQLLVDWNDTAADYPRASCAHQLFEAQMTQMSQAGALRYGNAEMSYAELNQVKVRGFRIELGEIESVLAHLPGVRETVVVAHRRSDQDVRLIAYVAPVAGTTLDERILRQSLSEILPAHMLPSAFVLLPALPLTGNGKVDRAALPLPDGLRPQLGSAYADPGSEAEKRIAAIWRELLEVERVGVDDNFFELGGHSLLVIPLRDRLQALFGRPLSPVDIFRLPTVAAQARFMTQDGDASQQEEASQTAARRRDAFRQMKDKRQNRG